jgi:hypothetical protein
MYLGILKEKTVSNKSVCGIIVAISKTTSSRRLSVESCSSSLVVEVTGEESDRVECDPTRKTIGRCSLNFGEGDHVISRIHIPHP